jgi:hypothetical protein
VHSIVYGESFRVKFHSDSCAFYCLRDNSGLQEQQEFTTVTLSALASDSVKLHSER